MEKFLRLYGPTTIGKEGGVVKAPPLISILVIVKEVESLLFTMSGK